MPILAFLLRECRLFVLFSWRDWLATIVPICLFTAPLGMRLPLYEAIRNSLLVLAWSILYIYSFNLLTQSLSAEEDVLNKPDRPIPSGKTSVRATQRRCAISWTLFFATNLVDPRITPENFVHLIMSLFVALDGPGQHWIGKNTVAMTTMGAAMLSTSRKLMRVRVPENWEHIFAIALWTGIITPIQDFRDQVGDKHQGRRTLPITFGDNAARSIAAFLMVPAAFATVYMLGLGKNAPWLLALMHARLGYRLLALRNRKADHGSYMLLLYIFCVLAILSSAQGLGLVSPDSSLEASVLQFLRTGSCFSSFSLAGSKLTLRNWDFVESLKSL